MPQENLIQSTLDWRTDIYVVYCQKMGSIIHMKKIHLTSKSDVMEWTSYLFYLMAVDIVIRRSNENIVW